MSTIKRTMRGDFLVVDSLYCDDARLYFLFDEALPSNTTAKRLVWARRRRPGAPRCDHRRRILAIGRLEHLDRVGSHRAPAQARRARPRMERLMAGMHNPHRR